MQPKSVCHILILAAGWWFAACNAFPESRLIALDNISTNAAARFDRAHATVDERLRITSIENNAVIPRNHLCPIVEWDSPEEYSTAFLVELKSEKRALAVLLRNGLRWQPVGDEFSGLLNDREVFITVYSLIHGRTSKSRPVRLVISERPLTDRIVYRLVPLYFTPGDPVAISLLFLHQSQPTRLLEVQQSCVGCHAYATGTAVFNCVKKKTRKAVTMIENNQRLNLRHHVFKEFSFVSLSLDGKYAALVKNTSGKIIKRKNVGDPFDFVYNSGDIYIYSFESDTLEPLPGASEPQFTEDMPSFSPDGQKVMFSRYQAVGKAKKLRAIPSMDLYEVPFNSGKGGEATPLPNASANQMHHYFARYTPDGKWISFCRADATKGVFARKDSDIHLLSRADHDVTALSLNKAGTMDSWHDWSSDSRWLIFSSKRDKNQVTALYLSYVDENGKDHPPIKVADDPHRKINTPQFAPATLAFETVGNISDFIYGCFE